MNPLDLKYHVISIVAVFMALGVGIFLGSNTNFMDVKVLVKKQDAMIHRLEQAQKSLEGEQKRYRQRQNENNQYIRQLEEKTIPLLFDNRLTGVHVGVIAVSAFHRTGIDQNVVGDLLASCDASVEYKLNPPLDTLSRNMEAATPGVFIKLLAATLAGGATSTTPMISEITKNGWVLEGGFEKPVQGVVFVIGDNADPRQAQDVLFPLQRLLSDKLKIPVANVAFGHNDNIARLFKAAGLPVQQDMETVTGQVEFIAGLWQNINVQRESFDPATDMPR